MVFYIILIYWCKNIIKNLKKIFSSEKHFVLQYQTYTYYINTYIHTYIHIYIYINFVITKNKFVYFHDEAEKIINTIKKKEGKGKKRKKEKVKEKEEKERE